MYDYDMYSKYVMFLFLVSIASWQKKKTPKNKNKTMFIKMNYCMKVSFFLMNIKFQAC